MKWIGGGCHCRRVRFEVLVPPAVEMENCNCSICKMSGYLHLIVPRSRFRIQRGQELTTTYRFNSKTAAHIFCSACGIKSYYIPRSNPDGVDVNLNCLDYPPEQVKIVDFDGQNWEQNAHSLAHKSLE